MKQLNSIEHLFFDMESGNMSLDVSSLHFYDPSTAPKGKVSFQQVFNRFSKGLDLAPVLKRKLLSVPLNLDHPYWVEDADFDLNNHLEHIKLPAPGSWEQVMATTEELFNREIPRDKPLWFGAIITGINDVDGLPENCYAMFLKMHHAAVDGASGRQIQQVIHDLKPNQSTSRVHRPPRTSQDSEVPSRFSLLTNAYPNNIRKSLKAGGALIKAVPGIAKDLGGNLFGSRRNSQANDDNSTNNDDGVPVTCLNPKDIGDAMRIDGRMFALDDVKAMRSLVPESTINDIIFAIIAGGMRRYLLANNDLPTVPLTAGMPIDVRADDDEDASVMIMAVMTKLFTNIEDPIERIRVTHQANADNKDSATVRRARPMLQVLENTPHPITSPLLKTAAFLADKINTLAMHTLITNVPGIPVPIYLAGGRMIGLMGVVPAVGRTGLTHAVFSTADTISIAATCGSRVMTDTQFYMECIEDSFDEYLAQL